MEDEGSPSAPHHPPPRLTEPSQPLHQPRGAHGSGAAIHSPSFLRDKEKGDALASAACGQVRQPRRGEGRGAERLRHPRRATRPRCRDAHLSSGERGSHQRHGVRLLGQPQPRVRLPGEEAGEAPAQGHGAGAAGRCGAMSQPSRPRAF